MQVSGTGEGEVCRLGWVNQVWNWLKGDGCRAERCSVECLNCAACAAWWHGSVPVVVALAEDEDEAVSPGAKMSFSFTLDMLAWVLLL